MDGSAEGVEYWVENELTPLGVDVGAGADGLDGAGDGEEATSEVDVEGIEGEGWGVVDGAGGGGGVSFGSTPSPGDAGNGTAFGSVVTAGPLAPVSVAWPWRD